MPFVFVRTLVLIRLSLRWILLIIELENENDLPSSIKLCFTGQAAVIGLIYHWYGCNQTILDRS
jgi:hypothetical protein